MKRNKETKCPIIRPKRARFLSDLREMTGLVSLEYTDSWVEVSDGIGPGSDLLNAWAGEARPTVSGPGPTGSGAGCLSIRQRRTPGLGSAWICIIGRLSRSSVNGAWRQTRWLSNRPAAAYCLSRAGLIQVSTIASHPRISYLVEPHAHINPR
jgi:hypothetical protein